MAAISPYLVALKINVFLSRGDVPAQSFELPIIPGTQQASRLSGWKSSKAPDINLRQRSRAKHVNQVVCPKCSNGDTSNGQDEEGGFMFRPPPGTPLTGPVGSEPAGKDGQEKGKTSALERAAAYKEQAQKKPSTQSGALSAMARAKAYRAKEAGGQSRSSRTDGKPLPQPLDAPSTLPEVEIIRGKSVPANVRTARTFEESGTAGSPKDSLPPVKGGGQGVEAAATEVTKGNKSAEDTRDRAASEQSTPQSRADIAGSDMPQERSSSESEGVSLAALLSQKDYEIQQAEMVAALESRKAAEEQARRAGSGSNDEASVLGSPEPKTQSPAGLGQTSRRSSSYEVEIITRDGIIKRKVDHTGDMLAGVDMTKKGISSQDFIGLDFDEKKGNKSRPSGLSAAMDMPSGPLPQVEIITRDANQQAAKASADPLYKPKVSTWGVFPRPRDISSTYGGGRTIRPGDALESPEEKEARERKTRELLEEYRRIAGIDLDPKTKAECDVALQAGLYLMDGGKLAEAIDKFDTVMAKTVFKHVLHGSSMLQKALCLDSLARSQDARNLYEKLTNHPDGGLRKKARQMLFGFQAAETLRVGNVYNMDTSMYRQFFNTFADGYNSTYKATEEDGNNELLKQFLPYSIVLLFPFVLVLAAAKLKGTI